MRKRVVCAGVALAVLLACGLLFFVWRQGSTIVTAELAPLTAQGERDFVRADLTYDAGTRTLRGTQTIEATNRTGAALSEIVLRLPMCGENADGTAISAVTVDGRSASYKRDEEDDTLLHIALDWQPETTATISFTLMIKHEKTDGAAVITLPALSMIVDGAWQTAPYDALAGVLGTQAFDYALNVIVRDDTTAAFGGALTAARWETGIGETLYSAQMQGARDVSFALFPGGSLRQREIGGVLVSALSSSAGQANALLARAQEALKSLERLGLAYPFPSLTVVSSDTGRADGEAYSGLIALSTQAEKEALIRRMTRLIARQTFGVSAGCDAYGVPWLSHTLASAAELLAYRERRGEAAFETRFFEEIEVATRLTRPYGVTIGAGVEHFGSDMEMTQVLRDQGAAMLLGIGQAVGYDALAQALCAYAEDNAGQIAGRQDLEAALAQACGDSWTGYLTDELAY